MQSWFKEHEKRITLASILLACLVPSWLLYNLLGSWIIQTIYADRVAAFLNGLTPWHLSLEFYYNKVNSLFLQWNLLICTWVLFILSKIAAPKQPDRSSNYRNVIQVILKFVGITLLLNLFLHLAMVAISAPMPRYWPVSVFEPYTPTGSQYLTAASVLLLFAIIVKYRSRHQYKITWVLFFGVILVLGTNLIHGWASGFVFPIAEPCGYYADAIKIHDPAGFLRNFEAIQSTLESHSKVHPPGAVLIIYFLNTLLGNPGFISIAIAITSVPLSIFFLYNILRTEFSRETSRYVSFLFILIPGIQIYYAATIDALTATFLLGALYCFLSLKMPVKVIGSIIFIFLASSLNYAFVFIFPVLAALELLQKRSIRNVCFVFYGLTMIYVAIYFVFNFNYLQAFMLAIILYHPRSFIALPVDYIFTRIEDVAEIILFFGPFLGVLLIRGIRIAKTCGSALFPVFQTAILTLLAMFIGGMCPVGETARPCSFIYPYMLFPVALYLEKMGLSVTEKNRITYLVFVQTLLMQLFGDYYW
jgi:hypothetical protein